MGHSANKHIVPAEEALARLREGNRSYLNAETNRGDISQVVRVQTCEEGQFPYAVIVSCSDSRVVPEHIFSAGIGELFVVRVAGNVIDDHQLGSIVYAVEHLGCRLVVVLGHEHCGAVGAAISGEVDGYVKFITDEIKLAIGEEKDEIRAACLNVRRSVQLVEDALQIYDETHGEGITVMGAIYRLRDGAVEFLNP